MTAIVQDADIRSGVPRIEGTRVTVLDIKRRVIDEGEDPHVVAGEYGVSMATLAYYYDHRDEFVEQERAFDAARRTGERRMQELSTDNARAEEQAD